jgi:tetratricopeptide (TPR) repeat protein
VASRYAQVVEEQIAGGDLSKRAKKLRAAAETRDEIVANVLAGIHDEIRYTGVEFGSQAVVPTTPAETLSVRFGDCKDTATLLVALLRELEIEARVALLQTGPGADLDPELPGLQAFDHAIVYVPGPEPLWIDTTARYARLGELPIADQGRHALIAAPDTEGLIETPVLPAEANRIVETREVFLPLSGGARIIETTEWHGHFEQTDRALYSSVPLEQLRERFEQYARTTYGAEELADLSFSDLEDLSSPLKLMLEMTGANTARTDAPWATVVIPLGPMLEHLPGELLPQEDEDEGEEEEDEEDAADSASPHDEHDFILPVPHVVEWHYRVHFPPGYVARELPEFPTHRFGDAVLSAEFESVGEEEVRAHYRLESGTRYTHDQVQAARSALEEFYGENALVLTLEQLGEVYLSEGRIREALQEFRKLAERFPEEPSNRSQLARAMLAAGFGEWAREEARRAVELSPESAAAHRTLGVILTHDTLGRKYRRGFDHAGAVAALRKAKELDPEDPDCRGELALLLEYDSEGMLFGTDARLDDAAAELQALRDELDYAWYDDYLLMALFRLGRLEELKKLAEESDTAESGLVMQIVAAAALDGAEAARDGASRMGLAAANHRELLIQAANVLQNARRYDVAAELLTAGSRGHEQAIALLTRAQMLAQMQHHEEISDTPDTPKGLVRTYMRSIFSLEDLDEVTRTFMAPAARQSEDSAHFGTTVAVALRRVTTALHNQFGSMDPVLDILASYLDVSVEESDEAVYRVRTQFKWAMSQQAEYTGYVIRLGDEYRIVAIEPDYALVGLQVLELVEQEGFGPARQLLDWVHEDLPRLHAEDPVMEHPFVELWTPDAESDADDMRLAAAALVVADLDREAAAEILEDARETAEDERRDALDFALLRSAGRGEDFALAIRSARALLERHPDSDFVFGVLVSALGRSEQWEEAQSLLDPRFEKKATDPIALRLASDLAGLRGDLEEWRRILRMLVATDGAWPGDYNNLAWADISLDQVTEETLIHAQRAVMGTTGDTTPALHTLGTAYADLGRPDEARDVLLSVVDSRIEDTLESIDWYILGRMAEAYELPDVAAEAYARVEPEEGPATGASTHTMALRRLARLEEARDAASNKKKKKKKP